MPVSLDSASPQKGRRARNSISSPPAAGRGRADPSPAPREQTRDLVPLPGSSGNSAPPAVGERAGEVPSILAFVPFVAQSPAVLCRGPRVTRRHQNPRQRRHFNFRGRGAECGRPLPIPPALEPVTTGFRAAQAQEAGPPLRPQGSSPDAGLRGGLPVALEVSIHSRAHSVLCACRRSGRWGPRLDPARLRPGDAAPGLRGGPDSGTNATRADAGRPCAGRVMRNREGGRALPWRSRSARGVYPAVSVRMMSRWRVRVSPAASFPTGERIPSPGAFLCTH